MQETELRDRDKGIRGRTTDETRHVQLVIQEAEDVQFVWTVDRFTDTVRRRKRKIVERENADVTFNREPITFFPSEAEALQFLVLRAEKRVKEMSNDLDVAKRRLAKCCKRLSAAGGAS